MSRKSRNPASELSPFLLTLFEAAQVVGVSPRKLRELKYAGQIGYVRIGRLVRYPRMCAQQVIARRAAACDAVSNCGADQ